MFSLRPLLVLALSFASEACLAHTGQQSLDGMAAGLAHPLSGSDHILAMLGVGVWAAMLPGANWRLPAVFMSVMVLGGILGASGMSLDGVEAGIAASVLVLGLLVAVKARPRFPVALAVTGLFALFHGAAHGTEAAEGADFAAYALGFVAATGLLHLSGIVLGRTILRVPALYRMLGAAAAAWGFFLLFQSA